MRKVYTRLVPRMFDWKMKGCGGEISNKNLKLTQVNWNLFMPHIVTGDETKQNAMALSIGVASMRQEEAIASSCNNASLFLPLNPA